MRKIFTSLKRVRLTDRERQTQQRAVVEFVLQNPEREGIRDFRAFTARWSFRVMFRPGYALVSMVALLLVGGGTSWAAEKALPGDWLYPVKIGINENVRTALTLTPVARAQWTSQQAVRRLSEAEKLAIQGRLDQQVKADLVNRFTASVQNANQESTRLAVSGQAQTASELNSHLEATLRAHQRILNELEEHHTTERDHEPVNHLIANVNAALEVAESNRKKTEDDVIRGTDPSVKAAAEDTLHTAEQKISEVQTFLQPRLEAMKSPAREDANKDVSTARESILEGKKKLKEEKFGDAYAEFQKAQRIAQETKIIVREWNSLGITSSDGNSLGHPDKEKSELTEDDERGENSLPTSTGKTIETPKPLRGTSTPEFERRDQEEREPLEPIKIELRREDESDNQAPDTRTENQATEDAQDEEDAQKKEDTEESD